MYCAYNETREHFLSADLEVADFSAATLDVPLAALRPESGVAVWILPFRSVHPACVRVPLDLFYLNWNCLALDVVELVPIFPESSSSSLAASLVILSAESIISSRISLGDHLLLCPPDEMRRRLQHLVGGWRDNQFHQEVARGLIAVPAEQSNKPTNLVLKWDVHSGGKASRENAPC